jgi:NADPH2:quinone reductase
LRADVTINYRKDDAAEITLRETYGYGADAAFDIEGIDIVARCLPAVRPFGRVACVLPPQGDLSPLYQKNITLHGTFLTRERRRLEEMRPLFERKQVRAVIDTVLPLQEVGKAHDRLDSHHGRGKIVLQIGSDH